MVAELTDTLTASEHDRIEQAEAVVRDYCGWHIAPSRDETVTFVEPTGSCLMLPSLYVTDVSSVVVDGVTQAADTYHVHQNGWIQRHGAGSIWYGDVVTVTFTHGYDSGPAGVAAIVQSIAQRAVDNPGSLLRTQDGPFSDTFSAASGNTSLPVALFDAERAVLNRYKIVSVA